MSGSAAFSKHPSSAVLLDHVAGTLGFAHHLVVATHLLSCPGCRDAVAFCEKIGSTLLGRIRPVEPPSGLLQRCLVDLDRAEMRRARGRRIEDPILPPSLAGLEAGPLRWLAPGIRHSTIWRDRRSTLHLIRVQPGVTLPPHRHRGLELTCVLSGSYQASGARYGVGDLSEEDDDDEGSPRRGEDHLVMAEPTEDCVCLMATTGRLRFTGWIAHLLQPVMPF